MGFTCERARLKILHENVENYNNNNSHNNNNLTKEYTSSVDDNFQIKNNLNNHRQQHQQQQQQQHQHRRQQNRHHHHQHYQKYPKHCHQNNGIKNKLDIYNFISSLRKHIENSYRNVILSKYLPIGNSKQQPQQHQSIKRTIITYRSPRTPVSSTKHFTYISQSLCFYVFLAMCYFVIPAVMASKDTPHEIFKDGKSDKEILDHLLKNSRYDKRLLPPVDDADFCCGMDSPEKAKYISGWKPGRAQNRGTLTVNVSVLLLSLASPDESSLKYEVEFLLQQQWYDPRLRYANQSSYDYLNAIHHHEDIWLPDTYFIMHGDFKDPIIPMHFALRIYRNGTINYLMRRHLILSCQGNLNIFPFDDPLCSFSMESISYEQSAITYVWKNDEGTLRKSPSLTTLNAYLIKNGTIPCPILASWRGNYSCLRVDLIFTRDRAFYFTTVFIPGIILVTSSFITFWLEWNAVPARSMIGNYSCLRVELVFTRDRAFYFTTVFIPGIILVTSSFITFWLEWNAVPARVMIGVTTMLNFFTTSNGFRSTLPVVSNLTAMNVWDGVCMCFIYASLLEFVCVNYVGRKRPLHNVVYRPGENPVTQRLPAVLSRIGIILASPLEVIETEFLAAISSSDKSNTSTTVTTPTPSSGGTLTRPLAVTKPLNLNEFNSLDQPGMSSYGVAVADGCRRGGGGAGAGGGVGINLTREDLERGIKHSQQKSIFNNNLKDEQQHRNFIELNDTIIGNHNDKNIIQHHQQFDNQTIINNEYLSLSGEKKRDQGGPNEIVACTSCGGGTSPCTHSANNGCATETCFVQVRKKEPPHPIRVAKTIDVIARITFPSAYSVFLIFFFIHYKGFS